MALTRSLTVAIMLASSAWPSFWLATQFRGGVALVQRPGARRASLVPAHPPPQSRNGTLPVVLAVVNRVTAEAVARTAIRLADGRIGTLDSAGALRLAAMLILGCVGVQARADQPSGPRARTVGDWPYHGQDRPQIRGPPWGCVGTVRGRSGAAGGGGERGFFMKLEPEIKNVKSQI